MRETLQACCLIGLVFASPAVAQNAAPDEMKAPRLSAADVDWGAVRATLADLDPLKSQADALTQLNSAIAKVLPKIAASPVPVLLPFDTAAYLHDTALGAAGDAGKYLSGFSAATLFFPGPSGFDAVLSLRPQDAPDLDLSFARAVNVQISGSALLYELDGSVVADETAVPQLDGQFPGIRRVLIESHLRYSFVRYGVPYFVSIECFDGAEQLAAAVVPRGGQGRHALPQSPQRGRRRAAGQCGEPRADSRSSGRRQVSRTSPITRRATFCPAPARAAKAAAPIPPSTPTSAFPWRKRRLTPTRNRS